MHDPEQQAREHQAHRHLRIDAGPTVVRAIAVRHFLAQPAQVENAVHARQDVILRHQLLKRAGDEQFQLIAVLDNPMIGRLLSHTQVETTARYAHLARDSVQESAARIAESIAAEILGGHRKEAA